jgi:uncharacterized membrane protein YkoI
MRNRTVIAIVTGTFVAVAVTGTALAANRDDDPAAGTSASASLGSSPSESPSESPSPSPSDSATPSGPAAAAITESRAGEIALAAAGGGTVTTIERETEHGRAVYRIRVVHGATRHDLKVDQVTGAVVDHDARTEAAPRTSTRTAGADDHGGRRDRDQRVEAGDDHGGN